MADRDRARLRCRVGAVPELQDRARGGVQRQDHGSRRGPVRRRAPGPDSDRDHRQLGRSPSQPDDPVGGQLRADVAAEPRQVHVPRHRHGRRLGRFRLPRSRPEPAVQRRYQPGELQRLPGGASRCDSGRRDDHASGKRHGGRCGPWPQRVGVVRQRLGLRHNRGQAVLADRPRLQRPLLQRPLGGRRPADGHGRVQPSRRRLGDRRRDQRGVAADRCVLRAGRSGDRSVVGLRCCEHAAQRLQRPCLRLKRDVLRQLHLQRNDRLRRTDRAGNDQRRGCARCTGSRASRLRATAGAERLVLHEDRDRHRRHASGRRLSQRQRHRPTSGNTARPAPTANDRPELRGVGQRPDCRDCVLSGLSPGTTYHYRLVAQSPDPANPGQFLTQYGYDFTLTTSSTGTAATGAGSSPGSGGTGSGSGGGTTGGTGGTNGGGSGGTGGGANGGKPVAGSRNITARLFFIRVIRPEKSQNRCQKHRPRHEREHVLVASC